MLFGFLFALAASLSEDGVEAHDGSFLPFVPASVLDAQGLLNEYPDLRIPIQRYFRFISSYKLTGDDTYGLNLIFGYLRSTEEGNDGFINISSFGRGGRISSEDQITFLHMLEPEGMAIEPGLYNLELYALLTWSEQNTNVSTLLFNQTVEFYEVINIHDYVASAILYVFFAGVVGVIIYMIFTKDKVKEKTVSKKKKGGVKDYAELVKNRSSSPGARSSGSGSGRKNSPVQKPSPGKK